ncbi:MAG: DUF5777 family beta-barrel protein [Bacteroidia bacterium]|nr:DUF5777 family beta-barrel protein [Bacteroidia bacterium]
MKKVFCFLASFVLSYLSAFCQDDLLKQLETASEPQTDYTIATFKSIRLINSHTIETIANKNLDFRISHRFGRLNTGFYEMFGLDQAVIRFGLDYGISDRLTVGIGRNTIQKAIDGYIKFKVLRQSKGKKKMPISLTFVGTMAVNGLKSEPEKPLSLTNRLAYTTQMLIARKFGERVSLQLSPTWVHKNLVPLQKDQNDILAIGTVGRFKITKRLALTAEYFYQLPGENTKHFDNSLSLGMDLETGGHVFQLHFTNSRAMIEKGFITETVGNWSKGDIFFGFNITRNFDFRGKKKW